VVKNDRGSLQYTIDTNASREILPSHSSHAINTDDIVHRNYF